MTDNKSYETAQDHSSESRSLKSGDISFQQSIKSAASKAKVEVDGVVAEKSAAIQQVSLLVSSSLVRTILLFKFLIDPFLLTLSRFYVSI